ncbi:hypothetical protein [Candidatus Poriferisodalis sp.]|uniref:hypothetical protein n=1 Tax=Candidatus Poriferisodalis sp. TaxID=3101277 RepID=UPI003AF70949
MMQGPTTLGHRDRKHLDNTEAGALVAIVPAEVRATATRATHAILWASDGN